MPQCIDGSEYLDFSKKRLEYFNDRVCKNIVPVIEVQSKVAKSYNYSVCNVFIDFNTKEFVYTCIINAKVTVENRVSFSDVCKVYHWKSFKFINDDQTISFETDPEWEKIIEELYKNKSNTSCNKSKFCKSTFVFRK